MANWVPTDLVVDLHEIERFNGAQMFPMALSGTYSDAYRDALRVLASPMRSFGLYFVIVGVWMALVVWLRCCCFAGCRRKRESALRWTLRRLFWGLWGVVAIGVVVGIAPITGCMQGTWEVEKGGEEAGEKMNSFGKTAAALEEVLDGTSSVMAVMAEELFEAGAPNSAVIRAQRVSSMCDRSGRWLGSASNVYKSIASDIFGAIKNHPSTSVWIEVVQYCVGALVLVVVGGGGVVWSSSSNHWGALWLHPIATLVAFIGTYLWWEGSGRAWSGAVSVADFCWDPAKLGFDLTRAQLDGISLDTIRSFQWHLFCSRIGYESLYGTAMSLFVESVDAHERMGVALTEMLPDLPSSFLSTHTAVVANLTSTNTTLLTLTDAAGCFNVAPSITTPLESACSTLPTQFVMLHSTSLIIALFATLALLLNFMFLWQHDAEVVTDEGYLHEAIMKAEERAQERRLQHRSMSRAIRVTPRTPRTPSTSHITPRSTSTRGIQRKRSVSIDRESTESGKKE